MARSIGRLRGYIFVERVPSHSLHVMIVLCYLPYHLSCEEVSPPFDSTRANTNSCLLWAKSCAETKCGKSLLCLKLGWGTFVLTRLCIVDACDIVHATSDEKNSIR